MQRPLRHVKQKRSGVINDRTLQAMGQMDNMTIGLWITGLMLVLLIWVYALRFAAAVAGFMGLV